MARAAPTDEQIQLRRRARRRLIGAMALVTLVAVVLPWVLESEPRTPDHEISIQIPSPGERPLDPRVEPGSDRASKPDEAEVDDPTASPPTTQDDAMQAAQDKALAAPEPAPAANKAEASAATESAKKAGEKAEGAQAKQQFVVQIAALADANKAGDLQRALSTKGVKAYTEKLKAASGDVTRVRVGPFPSREAAEKERERLKALGFEGNVTPR